MEYTTIQPTEIVDQVLAQKIDQADQQALGYRIDTGACEFCEQVREIAGAPPDPDLTEQKTKNEERAAEEVARVTDLGERLVDPPADLRAQLDTARRDWLRNFIRQVEAEHVQHQALIDNADVLNIPADQVTSSQIAQLVIEGARDAAVAELNTLGG